MSSPGQKTQSLLCLQCCNWTPHETLGEDSGDDEDEGLTIFVRCGTCRRVAVHWVPFDLDETGFYPDFLRSESVWPLTGALDDSVPLSVQWPWQEALRVRRTSHSSYVVQIRRCLEAICVDKDCRVPTGVTKNINMKESLDRLKALCNFPPLLADIADMTKIVGGTGAHTTRDVTHQEAATAGDFLLAIMEFVYVAPQKLLDYEQALKKLHQSQSG